MKLSHTIMSADNTREYFELTVDFDPEENAVEPTKFELVKDGVTTDITNLGQYAFDLDKMADDIDWRSKVKSKKYRAQYDIEDYENDTRHMGHFGKSMFH